MKKLNAHYIIYIIGLVSSIVFIGLYFIAPFNPWCILSCSIGASLIGAVLLGLCLDSSNDRKKKYHDKFLFQQSNLKLFQHLNNLLSVVDMCFNDIYSNIEDSEFQYQDKTIETLFEYLINKNKEIKSKIIPCLGNIDPLVLNEKNKIIEILNKHNESLSLFRKTFDKIKQDFEQNKNFVLLNNIEYDKQCAHISVVLNILGTRMNKITKGYQLIEFCDSFEELYRCKLFNILYEIGYDSIIFSNTDGYFYMTKK